MRGWLVSASGAIGLVLLSSSFLGTAIGGVTVSGAGTGTGSGFASGNPYICNDVPFEVTAIYLPGNRGIMFFNWASAAADGPNCFILSNGGAYAIGTTYYDLEQMPPVWHEASCVGNEAQGLDCGAYGSLGPYGGPASEAWYSLSAPSRGFYGILTAV